MFAVLLSLATQDTSGSEELNLAIQDTSKSDGTSLSSAQDSSGSEEPSLWDQLPDSLPLLNIDRCLNTLLKDYHEE